jgi:hypothetical protein
MTILSTRFAVALSAASLAVVMAAPRVSALQLASAPQMASAQTSRIVNVDSHDEDGDDRGWRRRRHDQHHHHQHADDEGDVVVEAPFNRVETGRRVIVDAPFVHVYIDRHGRHIVAPFVDLRVPR